VPRWLTQFRLRLRSLFRAARVEQELDDEMRYHLEREIQERVAAGASADAARLDARRSMGAIAGNMDACRDMRRVDLVEHRIQDLRFALRQLRKHPGFALTVIGVLALGIAANLAIFGFVDAALLQPLPYRDPSQLVTAFTIRPDIPSTQRRGIVSYLNFVDWRERTRAFSSMAAYDVRTGLTVTTAGEHQRVSGLRVTSGFFRTLGVTPLLGREFNLDEEGPVAPARVVLSYAAWQARFGARSDVLGQTMTIEGEPHSIIGVLPAGFHFSMADHAELWIAIRGSQACWERPYCGSLEAIARLGDGVSPAAATADLDLVVQQRRQQYPGPNPETARLIPLTDVMVGDVRPVMLMLLCGAGLLLLIAGINVVSLLLARSDSRTREIAVRNALGATSTRLVLQFATEALVLVAVGSVCGVALAAWGIPLLTHLLTAGMVSRMPYLQQVGLNSHVIAFAGALSAIGAIVFTLTPAVRVSVTTRLSGLKESARGSAGTTWRRCGSYLVVAQLAVAAVLLVTAGLLSKSLYRLLHVDVGFNVQRLAMISVGPVSGLTAAAGNARATAELGQPGELARQVAERVAALPGVESVAFADLTPLGAGLAPTSGFRVVGRPTPKTIENHPVRRISAGYFTTLQARLVRGRYFTDEEVSSRRPVMIVNATAVRTYFPDEDPIGKSIVFGVPGDESPARQIVGVVADIKDGPLETPAHPTAYVPFDQIGFGLIVRTSQAEQPLLPSLAPAIREVRPNLLVRSGTTMSERMNNLPSASFQRASTWLVGGFAGMALLLSLVGLYGVVAYSVGQRTREIGVRMALGAQRRSVYRLVVGEAAWLVGVGCALGIGGAVAAAALMRRLLFGVDSWDPPTLAATAALLTVSALLASYIPARRAASVNPTAVLRAD
jgi:predicted permease